MRAHAWALSKSFFTPLMAITCVIIGLMGTLLVSSAFGWIAGAVGASGGFFYWTLMVGLGAVSFLTFSLAALITLSVLLVIKESFMLFWTSNK
jgi:hypothetical protein